MAQKMCESGCGVEEHMDGRGEKGMVGKRRLRRRVQCGGAGRGGSERKQEALGAYWGRAQPEHGRGASFDLFLGDLAD